MKNKHKFLVSILTFSIVSCATTPPPKPTNNQSLGIAIYLEIEPPIALFGMTIEPNKVYFVRLDEGKKEHPLIRNNIIISNYSKDGYVYLLNAPPGRYIAIATSYVAENTQYRTTTTFYTLLPADLVKSTTIVAKPEKLVFMGGFLVKNLLGLQDADNLQKHYFNLIFPDKNIESGSGVTSSVLSVLLQKNSVVPYKGKLLESRQSDEEYSKFVNHTKNSFDNSGWLKFIQ